MSMISKQLPFSKNYYTKEELEAEPFMFNDIEVNVPLRKRAFQVVSEQPNGKIYKGAFKKGKAHGKRVEADLFNGTVSIGTWKNGQIESLEKIFRTRCTVLLLNY